MAFVTFWEQPSPIVKALQNFVEKDLGRDIHDVLRVDFAQEAVPAGEPLVFGVQFAECQYTMRWEPSGKLEVQNEERIERWHF